MTEPLHNRSRHPARASWILVIALAGLVSGCAAVSSTDDPAPTHRAGIEIPDAEELESHPCANPNWDEPPPDVTSLEE